MLLLNLRKSEKRKAETCLVKKQLKTLEPSLQSHRSTTRRA